MARQKGPIKIEGTIGDLTFLKTQDGYMVKEKSAVSATIHGVHSKGPTKIFATRFCILIAFRAWFKLHKLVYGGFAIPVANSKENYSFRTHAQSP